MILMILADGRSVLVNMAAVTYIEPGATGKTCRVWFVNEANFIDVRHSFATIQKLIAQ